MGRLAMFPLGSVALPGEALPLHVFEPRYRRLVLDCLADEAGAGQFGTALIEHGHEVGGGDQRASVATIARIVRVGPLPGGRFEMLASAVGRATVLEWLPDDPYPIADVEPWPDRPPADGESFTARLAGLTARVRDVRRLALEAARAAAGANAEGAPSGTDDTIRLVDDPVQASYQLATYAPFGAADRYRVLQAPSVETRLDVIDDALDDVGAALRFRLA
jgi:Lon protease-like protein